MGSTSESLGAVVQSALGLLAKRPGLTLVQRMPIEALAGHADAYPPAPLHKLFFEWELRGGELRLAGYGHGLRPHDFGALFNSADHGGPAFAESHVGRQLLAALRQDPFDPEGIRSRSSQDGETEWIEYDIEADRIAEQPGVFFALPPEFRAIYNLTDLQVLLDRLDTVVPELCGAPKEISLRRLLADLGRAEISDGNLLRIYRLGRSENRAPGWCNLLVSRLRPESLDTVGPAIVGDYDADHARVIAAVASEADHPRISASISVLRGQVCGIDLEGPYLSPLRSFDLRVRRVSAFCDALVSAGRLRAEQAREIVAIGAHRFELPEFGRVGLFLINHFKVGVAGKLRGRVKCYGGLILWSRGVRGPDIGE